jgi:hypothetical protein
MKFREVATMSTRIAILVVLLAGLSACSGNPSGSSASATASASPSATSTPALQAVAEQIFPYSAEFKYYVVCGSNGDVSTCPMTDRLKAHLTAQRMTLCRCQNPSDTREITAESSNTGGVAHIKMGRIGFDLIIVNVAGKLLVDDEYCLGKGPSTSIYVTPTVGC